MDIILREAAAHFLSEAVINIFSEAAARSLKNLKILLGAATHLVKLKKYLSETTSNFLSGAFAHFFS